MIENKIAITAESKIVKSKNNEKREALGMDGDWISRKKRFDIIYRDISENPREFLMENTW